MAMSATNPECTRISDQIRRAFEGKAWHGPSLSETLEGITPAQAAAKPVGEAHGIWELLLHVEGWTHAAVAAVDGTPMPEWPMKEGSTFLDWPPVPAPTSEAWQAAVTRLLAAGRALADRVSKYPDLELVRTVPGRKYDFYFLFHGIVQHSLYHGGQIALLKKAVQTSG